MIVCFEIFRILCNYKHLQTHARKRKSALSTPRVVKVLPTQNFEAIKKEINLNNINSQNKSKCRNDINNLKNTKEKESESFMTR